VKVALNSEEGLRLIRELSPRLILLDIMLGQSSGWSIVEALKKDANYESFKHLNIIMFSVSRAQKDTEMARTYQVKDFIHKPFEIHDLLKRVERWVEKKITT
jgi:DNA-binding response OmpR family regulator